MKEKGRETGGGGGGYVRADRIDLKSLDEQLQRHLSRVRSMEMNKNPSTDSIPAVSTYSSSSSVKGDEFNRVPRRTQGPTTRQEWEIDPSKLIIKSVIARGTFGTVHRGIYDGLDVAGKYNLYKETNLHVFHS